ncbi:uncharacterized protein TRUGW13939_00043 [Talaromyces rugulosus]|uniref:Fungal calcium binding protein domain-containing protein n=1 Tax=Talaromyces rugulosus TaxID=121627 RepID=A0A7H8QHC8_TALRU|nr:uncharacterized protein TRUGW13939_00043 [Talaromyces rugulosus]QKX52972.1 hypothetical protein TRUGW13939_00043 [Talaromyces rugulosus]
MQFTLAAAALFFSAAFAAKATTEQYQSDITLLEADGCSTAKCIASLAGVTAACGAAAVEAGLDPLADLACFGSVGASYANDVCTGCF